MKHDITIFEVNKRMFLAKNEFFEKDSSAVQNEYNDLMASNDFLKQRLDTKFKFQKHENSPEKMFDKVEEEFESKVSKNFISRSTFKTKNSELLKEIWENMKYLKRRKVCLRLR